MDSEIIDHQWYAVLRAERLGRRPVGVRRLGRDLVLWRDGAGTAHCADAPCPHRGASLALGRVVAGELECPYHGFRFDGDGACTKMPCEGACARIPKTLRLQNRVLCEAHGFLWLWEGDAGAVLPPVPWLPELPTDWRGSAARELTWNVRFSRVMEGMLDFHHAPFAHRRYWPSSWTRLDPYEVSCEGRVVRTRGRLRKEDDPNHRGFEAELNVAFPGILHIRFGGKVDGVIAVTPIDEESTWIVGRYTQYYVRIPGLRWLVAHALLAVEFFLIQPDDERMLKSSQPRSSSPRANHFMRADRGAAEWHRLRAGSP